MSPLVGIAVAALASGPAVVADEPPVRVLTNHVGYEATGPKHAVVQGIGTDNVLACSVQDAASGKEALALVPERVGPVAKWKDWHFWSVDFDGVTVEGTDVIACETIREAVRPFPFVVQKDLLERNT